MAEENNKKQGNDNVKWAVGALIALLGAGSGIAAIYGIFNQPKVDKEAQPTPGYTNQPATPSNASSDCKIEGTIFNNQDNKPMPNVTVYTRDKKSVESYLATNDPSGKFSGDCSEFDKDSFPLNLKVKTSSGAEAIAKDSISRKGKSGINIYVVETKDKISNKFKIEVFQVPRPELRKMTETVITPSTNVNKMSVNKRPFTEFVNKKTNTRTANKE